VTRQQRRREIQLLGQIVNHSNAPDGWMRLHRLLRGRAEVPASGIRFASPHPRHFFRGDFWTR
jgi:hypothetical protein